jgi:hypothetical protein
MVMDCRTVLIVLEKDLIMDSTNVKFVQVMVRLLVPLVVVMGKPA